MASELNIFALKYWAEKISLKKSGGQLERLSNLLAKSSIDLNPYQIHAAIYAFNSPLARGCIFADEVGLGKTIEAGIVLSQLWLEEKRRILLIVPASLRTQWKQELETHFGLESTILDTEYFEKQVNTGNAIPMTYEGIFIASLPFVYKRIKLIEKQPWDLVIVDEAHKLRRVYRGRDASKMAYSLREAVKDKPKLLLSATPLQNNLLELYGLVSFIDDKLLGNMYHFKTRFIDRIKEMPSLKNETLRLLRELVVGQEFENFTPSGVITRTLRKQVREYVKFPPRNSLTQDFTPSSEEEELYEKVSSYLQRKDIAAINATQRNLMVLVYRKLLASSSFAIAPTLKKLYERLEEELNIRNTNRSKNVSKEIENAINLEEKVLEELELLEKDSEGYRVPSTFSDENIITEIKELKEYYKLAISIEKNTKAEALIKALQKVFKKSKEKNWPVKAVVFTESRRTQAYLQRVLEESGISYIPFNGSNDSKIASNVYDKWKYEFPESAVQLSKGIAVRQALVHEFKTNPKIKVLLSTEAGAEGLNLQFANILVNYDLPWNPQRIEQRIGRVHRYGQRYEVIVANLLNTRNYADKRVLELLSEKLGLFNGLFGSSDEILGAIEDGLDFEQRILEIYQNCKTPEEIDQAFNELQNGLKGLISEETKKVRELLLDHFDTSITKLFRKTQIEITQTLSAYDQSLYTICKIYYGGNIKDLTKDGLVEIQSEGVTKKYLIREEKEEEKGKLERIHKDSEIIRKILDHTALLTTNPIQVLRINKQDLGKAETKLEGSKEGLIYLYKLRVTAIEEDEVLAPLVFINDNGSFRAIDYETSVLIAESKSQVVEEVLNQSPLDEKSLSGHWEKWKKNVLKKFEFRNDKLYTREMDRLHRYWDNHSLRTKDKIEKLKDEINNVKRKRNSSLDFAEKRKFDQEIQQLEFRLQKQMILLTQEEQEALQKKTKEAESLNEKLKFVTEDELIAVAAFEIYG